MEMSLSEVATALGKTPRQVRYLIQCGDLPAKKQSAAASDWLWENRRLRLKRPNASPKRSNGSFDYLGYRVSKSGIRPTQEALRRMQQRVVEVVLSGDRLKLERSIASYQGALDFVGSFRHVDDNCQENDNS